MKYVERSRNVEALWFDGKTEHNANQLFAMLAKDPKNEGGEFFVGRTRDGFWFVGQDLGHDGLQRWDNVDIWYVSIDGGSPIIYDSTHFNQCFVEVKE